MFDDLIGKPFEYGGRGPERYDCYGLALEVQRRAGVMPPDFAHPETPEEIHRVICVAVNENQTSEVLKTSEVSTPRGFHRLDAPAPFCFVTFIIRHPFTSHVGVVLEDRVRFIHAWERAAVCIERLDSIVWKRRITGYYTWIS